MEIISTTALISINATFIAQLLSFLIFVFILNRVMLRPLHGVIQQRSHYIQEMKDDITAAEQRLSTFAADLDKQKQAIRNEAFSINEELEKVASGEAAELFNNARKQIVELSLATEKDVARQLKEAQKYFEEETHIISNVLMEHILGRKINQ
jgi:F-type H+-transporting ATPase subunit b